MYKFYGQSQQDKFIFYMYFQFKKYISHIPNDDTYSVMLNEQCILLPSYPQLTDGKVYFIAGKNLNYLKDENTIN